MEEDSLKRILIVDDEPLILQAFSKILRTEGVEVKTVATGKEALEEISSCFYDLCFLDIHLLDAPGLAIMKDVKDLSPRTYVAIMTSSYLDDDMKRDIDEGADYFVPKPFDISRIKEIARSALQTGEAVQRE